MKIGELAGDTGLAPSRIRYYEALGLIGVVERKLNGYRDYPREAAPLLNIIIAAQRAGFSLEEIRGLLPQKGKAGWDHPKLLASLKKKLIDIEALQASLVATHAALRRVIERIESTPPGGDCFSNAEVALAGVGDQPQLS